MSEQRSWWGWGTPADAVRGDELEALLGRVAGLLPGAELTDHPPPDIAALGLPAPRVAPPGPLSALCSDDPQDRAAHAHGKSFRDIVRNLHALLPHPPDLVARPRGEQDIADLLDWCARDGIVETFETACTWDRFEELHRAITEAANEAIREVAGAGVLTCRFTHVYPDGPAPYYSVYAPGRWGSTVAQWDEIKAAVSEAIAGHGGTITHHHAVGRDHMDAYRRQRPEPFAAALAAAKRSLDPAGILNPGVLLPADR